ncbi:MAG: hypothetical protein VYE40_15485 [Myxococcota bacterium]|nr:hypothetical protein [Myxococcota bacterium]
MTDSSGQTRTLQSTSFLQDKQSGSDESMVRLVGPQFATEVVRLFKTADVFSPEHDQVRKAAGDVASWLNQQMLQFREDSISLQMTESNVFLNGQMIKFEEGHYARSILLRALFLPLSVNQIDVSAGVGAGEFVELLKLHRMVRNDPNLSLESFKQPHLAVQTVGHKELESMTDGDDRREVIELYAGLIIKCATYFHQLKRTSNASARFIKRLVQKIADRFDEQGHVFIGLINLKLVQSQNFVHAVNTALYSMFIAHEIKLDRIDLVRVAMTAITQDIHRLREQFVEEAEEEELELGKRSHFRTNMTSVMMLSEMGATDLLSALRLVAGYERGFPYSRPLPQEWYKEEMRPHLLSRIIELARHYDVLTQGMEGQRGVKADMALQAISEQMGSHYDPMLTKLFINLVGVYPVGEIVLLSTGEQALVIRSPAIAESQKNKSVAHRPTVRMLDGSERILDLSAEEHTSIRILKILDREEAKSQPGAFFFF